MSKSPNQIHILHVSPQLSRGDTCKILTWYSFEKPFVINMKNRENTGTKFG